MRKHLIYDGLVIFDGNIKDIKKLSLINRESKFNFLSITFNHRKFSLNQINNIRTEVENLDLDHVMFSIRPSFNLKKKSRFNEILQLIFAIKISKLYNIKRIYLPETYLPLLKKKNNNLYKLSKFIKTFSTGKSRSNTFFKSIKSRDFNIKDDLSFINLSNFSEMNLKFKKITDIDKKNQNFFWLGFDRNFQEVPWQKKYKKDYWYKFSKKSDVSKPLFSKLKYCSRCCLPETWEGISFDKDGICSICKSSEDKMTIE